LTEVPEFLARQAAEFAASGREPVPARPAATVLLLREPFEVYLVRRASTMSFAAGMYAFPGGSVDPRDAAAEVTWVGPSAAEWSVRLGLIEEAAQAVVCAAVREVFEECGVLLAGPSESTVVGDVSTVDWEAARAAVQAREVALADLLAERKLVLRADLLAPWARWITPESEPRRFDTFFFLARLPEGQVTRDVGGEAEHRVWRSPTDVDDLPKLPPTAFTLAQVAGCGSVSDAMAAAAARDAATPARPRIENGLFKL
jgi:8-oxo-dGTP pyrophosphatase MutT (NUDIX family)